MTSSTSASRLREIPRGVWALGFVSLFMDISSEMIHALLPVYLVTMLGASMTTVGLIEGIAEATAMIVKIFSGTLSDWLGRRKALAAFGYGLAAFTLSFAGYEAEIMRGAFLSVPRGELEAARAFGMSPMKVLARVWFPSAVLKVLPTLAGEVIGQLKSTPLIFTIPVMDLMGATSKVRQDTYLVYEPLILLAVIYMVLTYVITRGFNYLERLIPQRR